MVITIVEKQISAIAVKLHVKILAVVRRIVKLTNHLIEAALMPQIAVAVIRAATNSASSNSLHVEGQEEDVWFQNPHAKAFAEGSAIINLLPVMIVM